MEITPSTYTLTENKTSNKKKWRSALLPWLLLSPTIVLLLFVVGGPLIGTVWLALTDWNGILAPNFIGLENFQRLFQDNIFHAALINNFKWMAFYLTIPVIVSLAIALGISKITAGKPFYRIISFLPYIVPTVVTARIWLWLYNPYYGINTIFEKWNLDFLALPWISDVNIALFSVVLADSWHFFGFLVALFLIGLQQLDKSLDESARVEGANAFQRFIHVTLPQLRPTFVLIYMLLIIWSFTTFDYVYVMTQGGPGNATELIATYMYELAIHGQQPGYASAAALSLGIISLIVILGFGILRKKGWDI